MGIPSRSYTKSQSRRATIQGSQSNLRCAAKDRFGPATVLVYVNDIWRNIDFSITLFADDFIIYRKITNKKLHKKVAEGSGHFGGVGGRKWDENKSR